ncbi:MAG: 5-(carboxyamino)imidazole ribonucleotide mutase [Planctomycetota bacterium]|nr:MAG: 5-(carboxyamino)imidazole ribonucleotide mutase [Planctomycetota bacterium]
MSASSSGGARVVWVLGSDSDLPCIEPGVALLGELGISTDVRILSAHRTPHHAAELAQDARANGVSVLIGVAGGAAHLAGVLAAHTTLPVIGVPVPTAMAGGLDSLLATVQMPSGIPVATVAANKAGGPNAALLAARMLALSDDVLAQQLRDRRAAMTEAVLAKDQAVRARFAPDR